MHKLERTTFESSRSAEYFDPRELQAQTGQPASNFAAVALKELADNALDACETAGVAPEIRVAVHEDGELIRKAIEDLRLNREGFEKYTHLPEELRSSVAQGIEFGMNEDTPNKW